MSPVYPPRSLWRTRGPVYLGGGSRTSSSPFDAEGAGVDQNGPVTLERLIFASCPPEERENLSPTNSGPSRTVPYGRAVRIGELVSTSERHSCGGRRFR